MIIYYDSKTGNVQRFIDKLNEEYGTPKIMKFELSGKNNEVEYFINEVENWK